MVLGELKKVPKPRSKDLQGDPGGYPLHDNAVALLRCYQSKATEKGRPHANITSGEAIHLYWQWRMAWIHECLRHMRPWGNTPLIIEEASRDTSSTFS